MRAALVCVMAISSFAALPLSVRYDPFIKAQRIIKTAKIAPVPISRKQQILLQAIFDDRAFINGRFYRKGERIYGYRVVAIKDGYVVLRGKSDTKIVPLVRKRVLKVRER